MVPLINAAISVIGLKVEPDGYCPCTARLKNAYSEDSFWYSSSLIPFIKSFGLKEGCDTIARISPLFGSIAIAAPFLFPTIFSSSF